MAGYLLMANEFETLGIVVSSTHRIQHRESSTKRLGQCILGDATARRWVASTSARGYPADIRFTQSCIKESAERYDPDRSYRSLEKYSTVQALLDAAQQQPDGAIINVLAGVR